MFNGSTAVFQTVCLGSNPSSRTMALTGDKKRKYDREWVAKRRAKFFDDKKCKHCGSTENLELDHINPKTKISHSIWSWREERY